MEVVFFNLESLRVGDYKTYETLHDTILYNDQKPKDLDYELINIGNSEELFTCLSQIEEKVNNELYPIIHFDLHGSPEGIELRSGELVNWDSIIKSLTDINIQCGLNLFLSVGACFGISAVQMVDARKRAPFAILIAPNGEVYPDNLNEFYKGFFEAVFQNNIKNFFDNSPLVPAVFSIVNVETLYHKIFNLKDQKKSGILYKYFDLWKEKNEDLIKRIYDEKQIHELFELHIYIQNEKSRKELKDHFFMIDLYPENKNIYTK